MKMNFWGLLVALLGFYWLLTNLDLIEPIGGNYFWPGALIVFGLWLALKAKK